MAEWNLAFLFLGILLGATVLAGSLSSRFGLPALIGFLGLGMLAGSEGLGGIAFADYSGAQVIGSAALLFILFSGGLDTSWQAVRSVAAPALVLATAGVALSASIVCVAAVAIFDFSVLEGLLLGAIVGSTDAAAVFAVMRSKGLAIPPRVQSLIEFESGSNDPMAIFLVGACLALIAAPATPVGSFVPMFVLQMGLGAAAGIGVGFAFAAYMRRAKIKTGGLVLVVSLAAGLISYGLAAVLNGNGFLAAYLSGIVAGNVRFPLRRTVRLFQDGIAWLGQVVMFLVLGLLVFPSHLKEVVGPGLAMTAILMFVARPVSVFACLLPFRFDFRTILFVSWAGLRGAVPIVLATFPVVAGIAGAETIFNIVFFVVLVSSLVQGPTLGWAARSLGLKRAEGEAGTVGSDAVALKTPDA